MTGIKTSYGRHKNLPKKYYERVLIGQDIFLTIGKSATSFKFISRRDYVLSRA